jgi:hypothetical protein
MGKDFMIACKARRREMESRMPCDERWIAFNDEYRNEIKEGNTVQWCKCERRRREGEGGNRVRR